MVKSLNDPPPGVTHDYSITKEGFFKHILTKEEKEKLKNKSAKLQTKLANLTPEDYQGKRRLPPNVQKKIDFVRKVRKDNKGKEKFQEI